MKTTRGILLIITSLVLTYSNVLGQVMKNKKDFHMENTSQKYGVEGQLAPELNVAKWVDADGNKSDPVKLADFEGKFKVIYCFQAWCPGCHSVGLPSLKQMVKALEGNDKLSFMAIQTVFEGAHANTFERMLEVQKEYELKIPFGHDEGDSSTANISSTMHNFRTGGTPWFILIDENNKVIFNDFHLNTEKAIEYLKSL